MQSNKSPCKKAPWGGDYTKLDQFDVVENRLDMFRQKRIDALLDRGQNIVLKGKCHANDERI